MLVSNIREISNVNNTKERRDESRRGSLKAAPRGTLQSQAFAQAGDVRYVVAAVPGIEGSVLIQPDQA
jgi:hypothetical protein